MTDELPSDAAHFLTEWLGEGWSGNPLYGDASVRRYFRVRSVSGTSYMLALYPEEAQADLPRFLDCYRAICGHARIPSVLRHSDHVVAQTDVGDSTLFDLLRTDPSKGLEFYREAVDLLISFQRSPVGAGRINPPFDRVKFMQELMMTETFYARALMGADDGGEKRIAIYDRICDRILSHPYLLCHRDYHGQNLHIFNNELYMIDYQDMRLGPDTYDLASLLRDRGVARLIGREQETRFVDYYARSIGADPESIARRYLETLLQRSIKILGTFAMQAVTRERRHYLEHIPPTLESIRFCLEGLPEFSDLPDAFPMGFELQ